jgi:hypothetical protein
MTLSLVALWFLCLERRRVGGENTRDHGAPDASSLHAVAPASRAVPERDRGGSHACAAA